MKTFGPYSPVRRAGDQYFISGQVGIDPGTKKAASSISGQTQQAMKNLLSALSSADLLPEDVIKTSIYLTDMGHFAAMNKVYVTFFSDPRPARICIGVSELPRLTDVPLLIEIEAVAYKHD